MDLQEQINDLKSQVRKLTGELEQNRDLDRQQSENLKELASAAKDTSEANQERFDGFEPRLEALENKLLK